MKRDDLIIVRGGGDLATGTIHRLWAAGLRVLVLEIENPAAIRRQVALCEARFIQKQPEVEGLRAVGLIDMRRQKRSGRKIACRFLIVDRKRRVDWSVETGCCDRCDSGKAKSWNPPGYGTAHDCTWSGLYGR